MSQPIRIDIVSDTVCPWCYIGKRNLERALERLPDLQVDVHWQPFLLDASIPREGIPMADYLANKFGPSRLQGLLARLQSYGSAVNIAFDYDKRRPLGQRRPLGHSLERVRSDSTGSHQLLAWAAGHGVQNAVAESLFHAFHEAGRDIGDADVLCDIATQHDLDADVVRERLNSDQDRERIRRAAAQARATGVSGVPTFRIADLLVVSGAQEPDVLKNVILRAVEVRRTTALLKPTS